MGDILLQLLLLCPVEHNDTHVSYGAGHLLIIEKPAGNQDYADGCCYNKQNLRTVSSSHSNISLLDKKYSFRRDKTIAIWLRER